MTARLAALGRTAARVLVAVAGVILLGTSAGCGTAEPADECAVGGIYETDDDDCDDDGDDD